MKAQTKAELWQQLARYIENEGLHDALCNYTSPEYSNTDALDPELALKWRLYRLLAEDIETHVGLSAQPGYEEHPSIGSLRQLLGSMVLLCGDTEAGVALEAWVHSRTPKLTDDDWLRCEALDRQHVAEGGGRNSLELSIGRVTWAQCRALLVYRSVVAAQLDSVTGEALHSLGLHQTAFGRAVVRLKQA